MRIIDDALTMRYETVERNIKSKSNSFYDSFLDLLEATIKYILQENNIEYDETRTCGHILRTSNVTEFFFDALKIDEHTFSKLPDYIKKCNDHKHKKEKTLGIDAVINFMTVYFSLVNTYYRFIHEPCLDFEKEYFIRIFGETERLNQKYKEEVESLKSELKESYEAKKLSDEDLLKYQEILSNRNLEIMNLDDQNKELMKEISDLKDIRFNTLEIKLSKTIDMLNDMREYLIESRAATSIVVKLINGSTLKDEDLKKERERMEKLNYER